MTNLLKQDKDERSRVSSKPRIGKNYLNMKINSKPLPCCSMTGVAGADAQQDQQVYQHGGDGPVGDGGVHNLYSDNNLQHVDRREGNSHQQLLWGKPVPRDNLTVHISRNLFLCVNTLVDHCLAHRTE